MPRSGEQCRLNRFERWLLADIEAANAIVVNSDFAKRTFLKHTQSSKPIHTIYWGVDDQFIKYKHSCGKTACSKKGPVRFLFAGALEPRKGAKALIDALIAIPDAQQNFEIIGNIDSEILKRYPNFISSSPIKFHGVLPRHEVSRRMQSSHVFVFPSLSEGSARVVFEALACGCYVITTPNSGSIVEDRVHGAVIPPNDPHALIQAIQWAQKNLSKVLKIGDNNAKLINRNYSQRHYGQNLQKLYAELLT
jgi:glycosyltransferase involved in cell wall biosynthesis